MPSILGFAQDRNRSSSISRTLPPPDVGGVTHIFQTPTLLEMSLNNEKWPPREHPILERDVVGDRRLVMRIVSGLAMPVVDSVAVAFAIEKLDLVDIDKVSVVLPAGLLVVPGLGALSAFQVHPAALVKELADDLGAAAESIHGEPLRVFLQFTAFVLPSLGGGNGKLRNGRALLAIFHLGVAAQICD